MRLNVYSLLVLSMLVGACAVAPKPEPQQLVWPPAPETPRLIYEATLRNASSLEVSSAETRLQAIATNEAVQSAWLAKPYDIAAQNGLIVVSDTVLSAVHVFDLPRKKLFAIGWRGEGKLRKPLGVAFDRQTNIYVVDAALQQVIKYDPLGHYLATIGSPNEFSRAIDVSVSPVNSRIYILDRGGIDSSKHRFVMYSPEGKRLKSVGLRGHGDGEFNHPVQLAVAQDGRVFVLDAGNFRVQVFSADGDYLASWGKLGSGLGNLARPRGLGISPENYVFITDSAFQNFQIFNDQGQLLLNVGQGGGKDAPANYMLPAGIAADNTGRIYVVDQLRKKVEVFRLLTKEEREQWKP